MVKGGTHGIMQSRTAQHQDIQIEGISRVEIAACAFLGVRRQYNA